MDTPLTAGPEMVSTQTKELVDAMEADLDVHAAVCMPDDATLNFPEFYVSLFLLISSAFRSFKDFSKFAIGFPRGHGKTMFVKLLILYAIFFTKKKFILIVGASEQRAVDILSDVADVLSSDQIIQLFGNWRFQVETDRREFKKFTFNGRPVILAAAGQGTNIRGMNVKNARPDIIIFDDAQNKDCAESDVEAKRFMQWFFGTALKAKSPAGCTFLYIGNMYKDIELKPGVFACMLRNLQMSKFWKSFIVGALLADGTALWEELQSKDQLMQEFEQDLDIGQPEIFCAEVLNDPSPLAHNLLDFSKIRKQLLVEGMGHQGSWIEIDPATNKKKADETAIGYFELHDGRPCMMDLDSKRRSSIETVHFAIQWCIEKQCSLVCIEDVAFQAELMNWFEYVCQQKQITGINVVPMSPHGRSKNSRILDSFRALMADNMRIAEKIYARYCAQAVRFNPQKTDNQDDILDLIAYAPQMLVEYGNLMAINGVASLVADQGFLTTAYVDEYPTCGF